MCQIFKGLEGKAAHHIQPFDIFPEKATDIDNGITLCYQCHKNVTLILKERYYRNSKYELNEDIIINEELEDNEYIRQLDKSIE
jgi:hypothetical protein